MGEGEGCDPGMKQSPEESGLGGCAGPNTMEGVGVEEKGRGEMGWEGVAWTRGKTWARDRKGEIVSGGGSDPYRCHSLLPRHVAHAGPAAAAVLCLGAPLHCSPDS